uniref:Uncharacterized protein n=1 Tax=Daphnia galeata TaxID=27404 RepID=A0A8J2RSD7_9CRUS|nr:unnamed protein product [Daphnia galeata]
MNFKVMSILALIALVFAFSASAHPVEEQVKTTGQPEVAEPAAKRAEERDGWLLALKETYDQIPAHVKAELKKEVRLYNMKKEEERAQQQ